MLFRSVTFPFDVDGTRYLTSHPSNRELRAWYGVVNSPGASAKPLVDVSKCIYNKFRSSRFPGLSFLAGRGSFLLPSLRR